MLILTRRPGESLYVGDSIKLTVLSIQGKQIKLGLDVPKDMTVYREELYLRVKEQNRQAMATSDTDLLAVTELWQSKQKK
jgi:carbon storage regulator